MRLDQPFQWRQGRQRTGPLSNNLDVPVNTSLPDITVLPKEETMLGAAANAVANEAVDNALESAFPAKPPVLNTEVTGGAGSAMGPLGAAVGGVMEGNYGKAAGAAAGSVAGNAVLPGIGGIIGSKLGGLLGGSLGFEKGTKEVKEAPLGTGMAEEARKALKSRKQQLEEQERKAMGYQLGTPSVGGK